MIKGDGFVYQWTNINTGKWYIGSHQGDIDDGYIGSGILFKKAIKKYGINNFERKILYIGKDFIKKEEEILNKTNAANDPKSYNMVNESSGCSLPGEKNGMWRKSHSKETLFKMSKSVKNTWTEEKRKQHSNAVIGTKNGMYGRKHSEFSINKAKNTRTIKNKEWGFMPHVNNHRGFFYKIFKKLVLEGEYSIPRGLKIIELRNFTYKVSPYIRFSNFECRKLNINYIKKEFLWYLKGDKYDTSITQHAKMWKQLINNDGSINSNYGQYIFGEEQQFERVLQTLINDKDSRRAVIMILNKDHLNSITNDFPCTCSINFHIRNEKLDMMIHMRSQDAIFGMGNDLPCFSFIHEMMYLSLLKNYRNLKLGEYFHNVDSFHLYENHFQILEEITNIDIKTKRRKYKYNKSSFSLILCPKILNIKEVEFLRKLNFNNIPNEYKFTRWLIEN